MDPGRASTVETRRLTPRSLVAPPDRRSWSCASRSTDAWTWRATVAMRSLRGGARAPPRSSDLRMGRAKLHVDGLGDLNGMAAGQDRASLGDGGGAGDVVGADDGVAGERRRVRDRGAVGTDRCVCPNGAPPSTRASPIDPYQAPHSCMTASMAAGSSGIEPISPWNVRTKFGMSFPFSGRVHVPSDTATTIGRPPNGQAPGTISGPARRSGHRGVVWSCGLERGEDCWSPSARPGPGRSWHRVGRCA